ncbi:MAG: TetR/AcrR family transcriptional regulator [Thermodesulfobacteriota bacterium]
MAPRKDRTDKKTRILQALDRCLRKKPFDRTSIKDIAETAGVNHGLLHYYFKSKEDILIQYIDYILEYYKSTFNEWLASKQTEGGSAQKLLEEFFQFMNEKITLNKNLSTVFIEIWEIALYNRKVRSRLQRTYQAWIDVLTDMLTPLTQDTAGARRSGIATVAFLEGMALFSVILQQETAGLKGALEEFQRKIIAAVKETAPAGGQGR